MPKPNRTSPSVEVIRFNVPNVSAATPPAHDRLIKSGNVSRIAVTGVLSSSLSTTRHTNRPPVRAWIDLYRKYSTTASTTASTPDPNELRTSVVIERTSMTCLSGAPAEVTTMAGWNRSG